jgi:hypothetical protein
LLIALLLGVSLYLVMPLIENRSHRISEETPQTSPLMAERDRIINALQELDFDFKLGKIPEEDYPTQRAELLKKGTDILRQLDALTPSPLPAPFGGASRGEGYRGEGPAAEVRLEEAVSARRPDAGTKAESLSDDEIESMLAARRKARKSSSAGFCPRCGKPVLVTDQFCSNCGKALK